MATVKGVPNKSMTVAQSAGMAHFGGAARPAGIERVLVNGAWAVVAGGATGERPGVVL